ncbi:type VII secretion integral membrane protein EccD [Lentzea sp. NBC_00516]|uniref:type VII secretion integral membrane protein EccD n=1 Tax=Lentzea sp. NBC_00516 TaxID=2903582 RepID=UPI002E820ED6|nr:type VII secretion integral membrane protein EccD [Lentzea sp. NBC_00516]WUD28571.1 type VII secretion integral membrane protein EccD [Lentzea sp. NBC_00516]
MEERTQSRTNAPTRLRFVLGDHAVDVALPGDVQLVDLLPSVLAQFGKEWVEQSVDHEGWVAQRLGESPLDEDCSAEELNLVDGETVYLRPREDALPPLDYDDLVDGVAERVRADAGQWTPNRTKWMLRVAALAGLLGGLLALLAGAKSQTLWLLPVVTGVVLIAVAGVLARAKSKIVDGTALACVGVVWAVAGGWLAAVQIAPAGGIPVRLVTAAAVGVVAVVLALVAVADAVLVFTTALTGLITLLVPLVIWVASDLTAAQSAGIGITVNLIAILFAPGAAFRLGGLKLPMLPTDAPEVKEDIDPVPHKVVVERSTVVLGYLKAFYLGYGATQTALLLVLVRPGEMWAMITASVCALLLLLRSRHLTGTVPRWSVLVPAGLTAVALAVRLGMPEEPFIRAVAVLAPLVAVGLGLGVLSHYLPGKRLRPYWGRAVDIFEYATAIAVIPLLLAVLDVYSWVRGLSG